MGCERLGGGRRQRRRLRRRDRRRAQLRRRRDGRGGRLRLPGQRLGHHRHRPDERPRHAPVQPGRREHGRERLGGGRRQRRRLRRRDRRRTATYDAGETDEGAAFVFLGSASGITGSNPSNAHATLQSNQASADMGRSVAGAGDVNGDGYADVIVGAPSYDAGETDEGAAFVFLGSASGITGTDPSSAHATLQSNQADACMGMSVAGAGDVNGDGYADVIVGASSYDAGETDEGVAFVFLGSASGITGTKPSNAARHAPVQPGLREHGHERCGSGRRQRRRLRRRDRRRTLLRRGRGGRGGRLRLPGRRLWHHRHRPEQRPRHAPVQPGRRVHGQQRLRGG